LETALVSQFMVYADATRIYLAPAQPKLHVLARDRAANFPVIQTIDYSGQAAGLTAVRGDDQYLYVGMWNGPLAVYRKTTPLQLVTNVSLPTWRVAGLASLGDYLYVGVGQVSMAVDDNYVYLCGLNTGDKVLEVEKNTWRITREYGAAFEAGTTVIYDRRTGARYRGFSTPYTYTHPDLYSDGRQFFITGWAGVYTYSMHDFALQTQTTGGSPNTMIKKGPFMITGTESGNVYIYDSTSLPHRELRRVDLKLITGFTATEAIEIRSVWTDEHDSLVFCGSSWGNDKIRGTNLPAFFVLDADSSPALYPSALGIVACPGRPTELKVKAVGRAPFAYQWLKNGTNLVGENNAALSIAAAQESDVARYNLVVTNGLGSIVSPPLTLGLLQLRREQGRAVLDICGRPGVRYRLESRETLEPNGLTWSEMISVTMQSNRHSFTDPMSFRPKRFYRAVPTL
jgi:hypothetical protein